MNKFSSPVIQALKYYVYIYSHPVTGEIFYIGKGKGNRIFQHLHDTSESKKVQYIQDLKSQDLTPKLEIIVHGLDDTTALRVESAMIDLLDINNLTNKQSGYKSASFGRMTLQHVNALYDKEPVEITDPVILIRINQAFRYNMSAVELYDHTRCHWKLNPDKASKVNYALSIYEGVVQEVYEIYHWHEAGATFSIANYDNNSDTRKKDHAKGRYEFIGHIADKKVREKYRFKSVGHYFRKGNSNPIMYKGL